MRAVVTSDIFVFVAKVIASILSDPQSKQTINHYSHESIPSNWETSEPAFHPPLGQSKQATSEKRRRTSARKTESKRKKEEQKRKNYPHRFQPAATLILGPTRRLSRWSTDDAGTQPQYTHGRFVIAGINIIAH